MGRLNNYMIENDHHITPARMISLMKDYLKVIKALYPDDKTVKMIKSEFRERVRTYISSLMSKSEGTLVLSSYPNIELEYRILDDRTIVYRLIFMGDIAQTDWVTIAEQRSGTVKMTMTNEVSNFLHKILEDKEE
jgi:hypothetical protein